MRDISWGEVTHMSAFYRKGAYGQLKQCFHQSPTWSSNKILLELLTGLWMRGDYRRKGNTKE